MLPNHVFEAITRKIIAAIEQGAHDFEMPWQRWAAGGLPCNASSQKPYRGINSLLLWAEAEDKGYSSGRWATYRQWTSDGAQVRKGEKGTCILFWSARRSGDADDNEGDDAARRGVICRSYSVFNADQVEGEGADQRQRLAPEPHMEAIGKFFAKVGANIRHGGNQACYIPSIDQIWLPQFAQFHDHESYYSVLAHETIHWTGATHRLARDLSGTFASESYAAEELVAELGAAFLLSYLDVSQEPRRDHAAYIAAWLRLLHDDSRAILKASAQAQRAFDFLLTTAASDPQCSGAELSSAAGAFDLRPGPFSEILPKAMMPGVAKVTKFRCGVSAEEVSEVLPQAPGQARRR